MEEKGVFRMEKRFLERVEKRLNVHGSDESVRKRVIKRLEKRLDELNTLEEDDDDPWEEVDMDEENKGSEFALSAFVDMQRTFKSEEDNYKKELTKEERIRKLQQHYEGKSVFEKEDMISSEKIDDRGNYGRTALHQAVLNDDTDRLKELLADGADASIKDNSGNTPYRVALLEGKMEIIKIFEENGVTE